MADEPVKNKISLTTVFFSILVLILTVFSLYLYLESFFPFPRLLLSSVNNSSVANSLITNNNNTYLTLLQELIISASIIFGFYAVLFSYFVDHITEFIDTYAIDRSTATFIKVIIFLISLSPFLLIFSSISLSLDATIIHGTLNTHLINTTVSNSTSSVYVIINNTHGINTTVSNKTSSVYFTIKKETYDSIYDLFLGAGIIVVNLIILLLARLLLPALPKKLPGEVILLIIWFVLFMLALFYM